MSRDTTLFPLARSSRHRWRLVAKYRFSSAVITIRRWWKGQLRLSLTYVSPKVSLRRRIDNYTPRRTLNLTSPFEHPSLPNIIFTTFRSSVLSYFLKSKTLLHENAHSPVTACLGSFQISRPLSYFIITRATCELSPPSCRQIQITYRPRRRST